VCGEEGRVEVVLVNPCATPLRLDGLQLQVQPHQPSILAVGAGADSQAAAAQQQQQQQQRSVSVMLAAGSKPVKVVLSYVPSRPGLVAITGVQVGPKQHEPWVAYVRCSFVYGLLVTAIVLCCSLAASSIIIPVCVPGYSL
jgi:hypothetical protein